MNEQRKEIRTINKMRTSGNRRSSSIRSSRHIDEDSVIRGFPKHERGKIRKELVRKNLVFEYPSVGQTHVSLNPFQIAAVKQILDESNNC